MSNSRTVHLVYSLPSPSKKLYKALYKISQKLNLLHPLYRNGNFIDWPEPVYAPFSIPFNICNTLKNYYKLRLYNIFETADADVKPDDIIMVHLWPNKDFTDVNTNLTSYKLLEKCFLKNKVYVLSPYNHDIKQILWMKNIFKNFKGINFIPICGDYWLDTWSNSPFKDLIKKEHICHVNMGIDPFQYKKVKFKYSPKGKRKFIYIGRTDYPKNIEMLENLASNCKNFKGGYISSGTIKGWEKISNYCNLTDEYMTGLASEYDFFISTSVADAQATTILESVCRGFGVAATLESGFDSDGIIKIDINNIDFNCQQINVIQNMEEEEIIKLNVNGFNTIKEKNNWKNICNKILNFLEMNK
ncbi:MAG: hypothetical protein QMC67_09330 [Candidatus Wallbacteria bacterium]